MLDVHEVRGSSPLPPTSPQHRPWVFSCSPLTIQSLIPAVDSLTIRSRAPEFACLLQTDGRCWSLVDRCVACYVYILRLNWVVGRFNL